MGIGHVIHHQSGRLRFRWPLPVLALLLLLSGCDTVVGDLVRQVSTAERGALTIRLRQDASLLNPLNEDPSTRQVTSLMFSGLVKLDDHLRARPDLAERWEVKADGMIWVFYLRPDLFWHDGTLLTADDVAFTLRLYMDERIVGDRFPALQLVVEDVTALNSSTLRISLHRPFAPLLTELAAPILPRHLLASVPRPDQVPMTIGNGPFRLADRQSGSTITLRASPTYYRGEPRPEEVTFVVIPEESIARQELAAGRLLLAEVNAETAAALPSSLQRHTFPELGYNYVGFNLREGRLFADRNLRLAWAYGVGKEAVTAEATGGNGLPIWSHIPPASWAYDTSLPRPGRDIARAMDALAASGWRDEDGDGIVEKEGRRLSFDLLVREDAHDRVAAARLMALHLREVGMDARVRPTDFAADLTARRRPPFDFEAMIMGWDLGPDPDDYYLLASGQIPSPDRPGLLNYVGFQNQEFDRLSNQGRYVFDYARRAPLYRQTQRIVAEELPFYPLWAQQSYLVASPHLAGPLTLDSPRYMWNIDEWYVKQ